MQNHTLSRLLYLSFRTFLNVSHKENLFSETTFSTTAEYFQHTLHFFVPFLAEWQVRKHWGQWKMIMKQYSLDTTSKQGLLRLQTSYTTLSSPHIAAPQSETENYKRVCCLVLEKPEAKTFLVWPWDKDVPFGPTTPPKSINAELLLCSPRGSPKKDKTE